MATWTTSLPFSLFGHSPSTSSLAQYPRKPSGSLVFPIHPLSKVSPHTHRASSACSLSPLKLGHPGSGRYLHQNKLVRVGEENHRILHGVVIFLLLLLARRTINISHLHKEKVAESEEERGLPPAQPSSPPDPGKRCELLANMKALSSNQRHSNFPAGAQQQVQEPSGPSRQALD